MSKPSARAARAPEAVTYADAWRLSEDPKPQRIRIHLQRSLGIKLPHMLNQMTGIGNFDTDTSQILSKDPTGLLVAIGDKCAFIPWSNVTWIECL